MERINTYRDFVGELRAVYRRTKVPSTKIKSSEDAVDFMKPYFEQIMDDHEEVKVMHLNRSNGVVNVHHVTSGTDSGSLVPVKDILRNAILIKTSGIILAHNHPSGNLTPSNQDMEITSNLKQASELMEIILLDHIILSREGHYSFVNSGIL